MELICIHISRKSRTRTLSNSRHTSIKKLIDYVVIEAQPNWIAVTEINYAFDDYHFFLFIPLKTLHLTITVQI